MDLRARLAVTEERAGLAGEAGHGGVTLAGAEGFGQFAQVADAAGGVDGAGEDGDPFGGGAGTIWIALAGIGEGELGVNCGGVSRAAGVPGT